MPRKKRHFDSLLFERLPLQIANTKDAPRADDLYYRCALCDSFVSSVPKDSVSCRCRNIHIDVGFLRLHIKDYSKFDVFRLLEDDLAGS